MQPFRPPGPPERSDALLHRDDPVGAPLDRHHLGLSRLRREVREVRVQHLQPLVEVLHELRHEVLDVLLEPLQVVLRLGRCREQHELLHRVRAAVVGVETVKVSQRAAHRRPHRLAVVLEQAGLPTRGPQRDGASVHLVRVRVRVEVEVEGGG
eukprot:scaffold3116_cov77-Phaeocystis_antarctica.AAC.3